MASPQKIWPFGQHTNIRAAFGRDGPIELWIIQMIPNHLFLSTLSLYGVWLFHLHAMTLPEDVSKSAADSIGKLTENVYSDALSPAVRRVGGALDTLFKVGLSPVAILDWGFERSKVWLSKRIEARMAETPDEYQQQPPLQIAAPLLLAIAANAENEGLRDLFGELLLKAMDSRTAGAIHPSYVSVLGQLTPQEALVFVSFRVAAPGGSLFIDLPRSMSSHRSPPIEQLFDNHCKSIGISEPKSQVWLENLLRLRLLELTTYTDAIYHNADYDAHEPSVETRDERHLTVTEYGRAFLEACAPKAAI